MGQKKVYIFIDEFGNSHLYLSKSGTFSHFVYTAFLITEDELEKARLLRKEISKKYFQNTHIKSKNIKNNEKGFQKRLLILNELKQLNYIIHSIVIDKSKINSEGLKHKKVFYKYFHRLLIEKFPKKFHSFEIFFDKLGYPKFQNELTTYINKYIDNNLFQQDRKYKIADDITGKPLIQIADFLSGCVGKIFCVSHIDKRADVLFEQINDRLYVNFFPYEKEKLLGLTYKNNIERNLFIKKIAFNVAVDFLNSDKIKETDDKEILQYLILINKITPERIVSSQEIISVVKKINLKFDITKLRVAIQRLRDYGVIIVSPQGEKGYKIPNNLEDIVNFYNRYLNSIVPMLKRINISNKIIIEKSNFKIRILNIVKEFQKLQQLINIVEKH